MNRRASPEKSERDRLRDAIISRAETILDHWNFERLEGREGIVFGSDMGLLADAIAALAAHEAKPQDGGTI